MTRIRRGWHGQRSWNGVAILARGAEPKDAAGDFRKIARILIAGISRLRPTELIVGLYICPMGTQPGPKFDYKLAWFEKLIGHAATLVRSRTPVIMAGDYNVVPTDFDIYNPSRG